ncbi:MAG: hypothetical protein HQK49_19935 [Oligoflexia bacterium]|nr:hypothetical protein [Oligoflexia bacterium]
MKTLFFKCNNFAYFFKSTTFILTLWMLFYSSILSFTLSSNNSFAVNFLLTNKNDINLLTRYLSTNGCSSHFSTSYEGLFLTDNQQQFIQNNLEAIKKFYQENGSDVQKLNSLVNKFSFDPPISYSDMSEMLLLGEDTKKMSNEGISHYKKILENKNSNNKVLALGEGGSSDFSIIETIAKDLPKTTLVQSDLKYSSKPQINKNIIKIKVDHIKNFAEEVKKVGEKKGGYDIIVSRKILCCCKNHSSSCGGIYKSEYSLTNFLMNASTTLNLNNPDAIGIFHGSINPDNQQNIIDLWEAAATNFKLNKKVNVDIVYDNSGNFFAIVITPKQQINKYF